MNIGSIIDNSKLLFDYFGWYSILLVIATTLLMIPINMLYKKLMSKESLSRLRKFISATTVYVVSLGLVAFFTGVVIKVSLTFIYLFGATLSCGFMSMLLWAIIKLVRDYGVLPLIKFVANSKEAKKWISDLGINQSIVNIIVGNVNKYLEKVDVKSVEDLLNKTNEIDALIKEHLSGFVSGDMDLAVNNIFEIVKENFSPKKEEVKEEQVKQEDSTKEDTQIQTVVVENQAAVENNVVSSNIIN